MVIAAEPSISRRSGGVQPGSKAFIVTLAMCMAITALGVDSVLPAYGDIRSSLGLAPDAVSITRLVSVYLLGNSLGLLPAGILSDRFGRRPVMWGGLLLYLVGAVGSILAPSLGMMLAARFVWGLGSSGPRVAALASVRDAYDGERMARQMSFIMAVFILVPMFAPTLSSGILVVGTWHVVFGVCAAAAGLVALSVIRLPETLPVAERRSLGAHEVWAGCRAVLTAPGTLAYIVALTAMFGAFISFLGSSEVVLDQVFGLKRWFPLYFGALSAVMGAAMLLNGRTVERVGLDRMIRLAFVASATAVTVFLLIALATDGTPPFWSYVLVLAAVLFTHQILNPNLNAVAMRPLAHVAGTGSAIIGMVSGAGGSLLAGVIDDRFDGTVRPQAIAFAIATLIAGTAWNVARRSTAVPVLPAPAR